MKAVCIGVIDATIDEVARTVAVTRVQVSRLLIYQSPACSTDLLTLLRAQPRVLTVDAVGVMADKLEKWCGVVKETLVMVEVRSDP